MRMPKGVFWGLTHQHQRADLCRAVLEGVSFALRQGIEVADKAGQHADNITLIGGGQEVNIGDNY